MKKTSTPITDKDRQRFRALTAEIRAAIDAVDYLAHGTLIARTKTCGRANCRCATDPAARHGPYHEWSRREGGRLVHSTVTPEQAKLLEEAISNHRRVEELLQRWHLATLSEVLRNGVERSADSSQTEGGTPIDIQAKKSGK